MNREQFIGKLLAIYRRKYKPTDGEVEEFRLLLEMMPDRPVLFIPNTPENPMTIPIPTPRPYDNTPVMYGVYPPGYRVISQNEVKGKE